MTRRGKRQLLCGTILLLILAASILIHAQARFVTTRGKDLVSSDGKPLQLKGINLGNRLLPEGYMFKFKTANSPQRIQTVINELVGEDEARRFWKTYHQNYLTQEDIRFIKRSGVNSARVPFTYPLVVSFPVPVSLDGEGYRPF